MITLVLGGARSGKSEIGERLIAEASTHVTYVATGVPSDDEISSRIAAHRARRPASWTTVEAGRDLPAAIAALTGAILIDSLGSWVARANDFHVDVDALCIALTGRTGHTVVVSDEVGLGVHPSTEAGRHFRDALGEVNHAVATIADRVLLAVAGRVLPLERT